MTARSRAFAASRNMSMPVSAILSNASGKPVKPELSDANEALQQEKSRSRAAEIEADDAVDGAASGIHSLAQRIEAIAARLESP
jgi:hypothetical protein